MDLQTVRPKWPGQYTETISIKRRQIRMWPTKHLRPFRSIKDYSMSFLALKKRRRYITCHVVKLSRQIMENTLKYSTRWLVCSAIERVSHSYSSAQPTNFHWPLVPRISSSRLRIWLKLSTMELERSSNRRSSASIGLSFSAFAIYQRKTCPTKMHKTAPSHWRAGLITLWQIISQNH